MQKRMSVEKSWRHTFSRATVACFMAVVALLALALSPAQAQRQAVKALSAKQIFAKSKDAIVSIKTDRGMGTGFLLRPVTLSKGSKPYGMVATCYHVIQGASSISVSTTKGSAKVVSVAVNPAGDAALLYILPPGRTSFVDVADTNAISPGDEVFVIGNPLGFLTQSVSSGILSSKRQAGGMKLLQITAPVSPGSSGSPILDNHGRAVGFVSFTFSQGQAINMGVAIAELRKAYGGPGFIPLDKFFEINKRLGLTADQSHPEAHPAESSPPDNVAQ